jgi:Icc-related predicted phosphoesterase
VAAFPAPSVRVAAVGDLHIGTDEPHRFRPFLLHVAERADVLLLAGDLTRRGTLEEAHAAGAEVGGLGLPVIAVLGNHDQQAGRAERVREILDWAGVVVLDGTSTTISVGAVRVGVAGCTGSLGGFATPEPASEDLEVDRFRRALGHLECDVRLALTHYAPTPSTLAGEPEALYPQLGSALLGEAIDAGRPALAVHGHAHHGREVGQTPGGVPVRNVAYPVIRRACRLYRVSTRPGDPIVAIDAGRPAAYARWAGRQGAVAVQRLAGAVGRRDR